VFALSASPIGALRWLAEKARAIATIPLRSFNTQTYQIDIVGD
jgi:hypothetical protein